MRLDENWLNRVAQAALSSRETLEASYDLARVAIERRIPGDFVECGVFAGAQVAAMGRALLDSGDLSRKIHLFDSFTGIPAAGPLDVEFIEAGHPAGLSACSQSQVRDNLASWGIPAEMLVWHPGLFADTMPADVGPIAILRLDGDLYESTKVCMEHLYPLVSRGGWVIADDYRLSGCRKAIDEAVEIGPVFWRKE